jgi:hypothetical protein
MKKDQYIPHEVSMRTTSEVMKLIEKEGMTGYGIYWAVMEYLRAQDNYVGDMGAMKHLSRQLKTSIDRLMRILKNYGLFEVTDFTFQSRKLNLVMKPLEDKRKAMDKRSCDDRRTTDLRETRNPLETSSDISLSKVKESKEENTPSISSSSAEAAAGKTIKYTPAWEQYVDSLQQEEEWKELMAMRTGLKQQFYTLFPRIVESFKRHVRMLGNEGQILSPSEAKRYFCFYLDPGSVTFKKLWEELHKPIDKGKYKYEDRDPVTGQRSYCGVPIPADAPPRPNSQAVWCDGKWVY